MGKFILKRLLPALAGILLIAAAATFGLHKTTQMERYVADVTTLPYDHYDEETSLLTRYLKDAELLVGEPGAFMADRFDIGRSDDKLYQRYLTRQIDYLLDQGDDARVRAGTGALLIRLGRDLSRPGTGLRKSREINYDLAPRLAFLRRSLSKRPPDNSKPLVQAAVAARLIYDQPALAAWLGTGEQSPALRAGYLAALENLAATRLWSDKDAAAMSNIAFRELAKLGKPDDTEPGRERMVRLKLVLTYELPALRRSVVEDGFDGAATNLLRGEFDKLARKPGRDGEFRRTAGLLAMAKPAADEAYLESLIWCHRVRLGKTCVELARALGPDAAKRIAVLGKSYQDLALKHAGLGLAGRLRGDPTIDIIRIITALRWPTLNVNANAQARLADPSKMWRAYSKSRLLALANPLPAISWLAVALRPDRQFANPEHRGGQKFNTLNAFKREFNAAFQTLGRQVATLAGMGPAAVPRLLKEFAPKTYHTKDLRLRQSVAAQALARIDAGALSRRIAAYLKNYDRLVLLAARPKDLSSGGLVNLQLRMAPLGWSIAEGLAALGQTSGQQVAFGAYFQALSSLDPQVPRFASAYLRRKLDAHDFANAMFNYVANKQQYSVREIDVYVAALASYKDISPAISRNLDRLLDQQEGRAEKVFWALKLIGFRAQGKAGQKEAIATLSRYLGDSSRYVSIKYRTGPKGEKLVDKRTSKQFSDLARESIKAIKARE